MLVVGLTGGIASGKSTVSKRLQNRYDLTVIDADRIAREVVVPGKAAYSKIVKYFGPKIPDLVEAPNSVLNRAALGRYVFSHKEELKVLNSFTHPAVRNEILRQILGCYIHFEKMCILDVPLLFEAGMDKMCGITLCVVCDRKIQLERLMNRNSELSKQDCENRIDSQMSNSEKICRADIVIDNETTIDQLYESLDHSIRQIQPSALWAYLEVICPPIAVVSAGFCLLGRLLPVGIAAWLTSQVK
ncbi:hypothetical protein FOA43_002392 [Brettanomyces nanus]|uniref:Dephospho-CoA kinase n=1 Tax=Eeniella nana TaxID=13502 RepID=A0A875S4R5_EENNA|nr:uncharacterized protein FOA43_002392 [Brettanomyces nanus]QPG75052.1 hypothetical protein FOA43_002392 [Brettanomyces nanus]